VFLNRHLLLGSQNLSLSTMIVINGSPIFVSFCFVGRQLSNAENHWSRVAEMPRHFRQFVKNLKKLIFRCYSEFYKSTTESSSFAIILYELNSRQGPFGKSGLSVKQVLRKVVRFGYVHEPIFRPPIEQLLNSFDFVRDCLQEAWSECPGCSFWILFVDHFVVIYNISI